METVRAKRIINYFTFAGIIIGLAYIILAVAVNILTVDSSFEIAQIFKQHQINKLIYFIYSLPVILGIFGYIIGKNLARRNEEVQNKIQEEEQYNQKVSDFVEQLRNGNVEASYEIQDESDSLGQSLINLRDQLKKNQEEEEKRKKEDAQRNWVTEGLAKFGEIQRTYSNDIDKLSQEVTSNLVHYIGAEQAGFFVVYEEEETETEENEQNGESNNHNTTNGDGADTDENTQSSQSTEETDNNQSTEEKEQQNQEETETEKSPGKYFQLTAHFAYERHKYPDKRVEWGEGLIGAAALEGETIYMKDTSSNYVNITSGLGKANPRGVLIVPLKVNEEVHGVIEIASFKTYEDYEINFVEQLGESIASTIASIKINMRTNKLLEESRAQAEKRMQQEEIMRQNMEKLKATQQEAAKQSEEFISFTNSVNHTMIRAEYDVNGKLIYANKKFLDKLEYSDSSEVEGQSIFIFINEKDQSWFKKIWDNLAQGGRHFEGDMKHVTKYGNDLWTMATYVCQRNPDRSVRKILFLAIDITESKKSNLDYQAQIDALNRSTIKAEFTPQGDIVDINNNFLEALNYTKDEVQNTRIFNFIPEDQLGDFRVIWNNVNNRMPYEGQQKYVGKEGIIRWFHANYTVVNDIYGEISKIIFIAYDITEQKNMEIKTQEQAEQLKRQEEQLQKSQQELNEKLQQTREEVRNQYKEIETVKMLNEKTLEGALDAIITINKNGEIEFFNKAAEDLFGINRKDIMGSKVEHLLPEENNTDENYLGNYLTVNKQPQLNKRMEVFFYNNNQEKVPILVTLSEARIGKEYNLTAFIQQIEVELF